MEHLVRHHQGRLIARRTLFWLSASLVALPAPGLAQSDTPQASSQAAAASSTLDFANGLYARRMYEPAIVEYEKFISANPSSPEIASAKFRFADSHYFMKNYPAAIQHFGAFAEAFPADKRVPIALFRIASSRFYLKDFAAAAQTFRQLSTGAEDPALRGGAIFYLAKIRELEGDAPKSEELFQQVLKEYPQTEYAAYAALALGDHYVQTGQLEKALESYSSMQSALPAGQAGAEETALEARFKAAGVQLSLKNYAQARQAYDGVFGYAEPLFKERLKALKDDAMLGIFYCDYYLGDLEDAVRRWTVGGGFKESAHRTEMLFLLASIHADKKDAVSAFKYMDELLAVPGLDEELKAKALLKRAQVLAESGKKEESLAAFNAIGGQNAASSPRALYEAGLLLEEMSRAEEAAQKYDVLSKQEDGEYARKALYRLAILRKNAGNPDAARQTLELYVRRYPADEASESAYLDIIQIELDRKNFEKAAADAAAMIQAYPAARFPDIVYYKRGVALAGLGRFKEAAETFEKVISGYPNSELRAESFYAAAVSLENAGGTAEAITDYETVAKEYAQNSIAKEAVKRLGVLYLQSQDYDKAADLYGRALLERADIELAPEVAFWLIQYLLDRQRYDEMQKILAVLPQRFPGKDFTHEIAFLEGESAMGLKDIPKAIASYSKAIEASAQGLYAPYAYLGRGLAHAAQNDYASAEKDLTDVLRYEGDLKPRSRAHFELANLALRSGDIAKASKAFMLVAILYDDPKYTPVALYKAGECFLKLGKTEDAEKAFGELKTRYPQSEWVQKAAEMGTPAHV